MTNTSTKISDLQIQELTLNNIKEVVEFILPEEKYSLGLMSRLTDKGQITVPCANYFTYLLIYNKKLIGVIMITSGGMCFHHLPFLIPCIKEKYCNIDFNILKNRIAKIFENKKMYCITGEYNGTKFIQDIIKQNIKIELDYELRVFQKNTKCNFFNNDDEKKFQIVNCTTNELEKIFPLQKKYDAEEVLPPGETLDEELCKKRLYTNLQKQIIIAIKNLDDNNFVAKAGTNALGVNHYQLGGVYTLPEYRGKGFARILVRKLAEGFSQAEKNVVLFVKEKNEPAKAAYTKAGFLPLGKYRIVYYSEI